MKYLSARETAGKWNISIRRVLQYLKDGRIDDAYLMGSTWAIPENAEKPTDPRKKRKHDEQLLFKTQRSKDDERRDT